MMITWKDRVNNLKFRYGRPPTLLELLEENRNHTMTPEELQAQRESFLRGMAPTGDPKFD